MQIRWVTEKDQSPWDEYVLNHPDGLAYQLFGWGRAVAESYGFEQKSLVAEEELRICGVLPLVIFKVPLFGVHLISLPYCDAGGVLADSTIVAEKLIAFAEEQAEQLGCSLEIRSTRELPGIGQNQTSKVRMLLALPDSSEQLLAGLKSKLRSQVKKPLRDGLTVKMGGVELVELFYAVFARNMRDLGSPVHSRRWIRSVVQAYGENCRVAIVYTPDGIVAASGIILLHSRTVCIPWASAVRKYNQLNPNMLLYWSLLAFASDSGYRYFDFGRSTPGEGTYRFKKQWGAEPKQLYWYRLSGNGNSVGSAEVGQQKKISIKRTLLTLLWQKIPLPVATSIGACLRKYISL